MSGYSEGELTDIICYGANIDDYSTREANFDSESWAKTRRIPFWSELAGDTGEED